MPRPLVFGNGHVLIQVDARGNLRDLCFPLGFSNHLSGRAVRIGLYWGGRLSWCDAPEWQITQALELIEGQLVGNSVWRNGEVTLRVTEWLEDLRFFRHVALEGAPEAVLFQTQAPHLYQSDIGDCAFFDPDRGGIVHYKSEVAMLFGAVPAPDRYACGITGFGGMEGTWRDAEDGALSMNSIAQGSVDSTFGVPIRAGEPVTLSLTLGQRVWDLPAAEAKTPPVGTPSPFDEKCLAILKTQIVGSPGHFPGAVLAANDSDIMETNRANYSYCWMRDGAHVGEVLDADAAHAFLDFCHVILRRQPFPYFLQKYHADGTWGAGWHPCFDENGAILPMQEDETASVVSLATRMKRLGEFTAQVEFLREYVDERGLPLPSFDLWEERRGVHTYTVATVIRALRDAGHDTEADRMTEALVEHLWDEKRGVFFRRLSPEGQPDWNIDSSTLHVGLLGVLPLDDPKVRRNADTVERALWVNSPRGGLARYEGDYYFRVTDRYPGNPWLICTLWLAQYRAQTGDRARAEWLLDWARAHGGPTGVLPEQIHPDSGSPLSVSPLTWSHAEYLKTTRLLRG